MAKEAASSKAAAMVKDPVQRHGHATTAIRLDTYRPTAGPQEEERLRRPGPSNRPSSPTGPKGILRAKALKERAKAVKALKERAKAARAAKARKDDMLAASKRNGMSHGRRSPGMTTAKNGQKRHGKRKKNQEQPRIMDTLD